MSPVGDFLDYWIDEHLERDLTAKPHLNNICLSKMGRMMSLK